jgi:hypothetical protein
MRSSQNDAGADNLPSIHLDRYRRNIEEADMVALMCDCRDRLAAAQA